MMGTSTCNKNNASKNQNKNITTNNTNSKQRIVKARTAIVTTWYVKGHLGFGHIGLGFEELEVFRA